MAGMFDDLPAGQPDEEKPAGGMFDDLPAAAPQQQTDTLALNAVDPSFEGAQYAADRIRSIGKAFWSGANEGAGSDPVGFSDASMEFLIRHNVIRPDDKFHGPQTVLQMFNEAFLYPAVAALDTAVRFPTALYHGLQAAGVEAGLPRDIVSMPDAFAGSPGALAVPKSFVRPSEIIPPRMPVDIQLRFNPRARSDMARTGDPVIDNVTQNPTLKKVIDNPVVDREHSVLNSWGGSTPIENPTTYIDRNFPKEMTVDGVTFDPAEPAAIHENVEAAVIDGLMKAGWDRERALSAAFWGWGEPAEDAWYRSMGIDPDHVNTAMQPILDQITKSAPDNVPPDLFRETYQGGDPTRDRPGPIERPGADDLALARGIIGKVFSPDVTSAVLKEAKDLGATGIEKPEPTFGDSPFELAEQAVPSDLSASVSPDEARIIRGHEPGEYDARGKEWIDKIDEPDDVRDAIEKIATENDFFPVARGGEVSPATRNSVAEAAGIHPSEINESEFSTKFDSDGKVRAVIQVLRQTAKDFVEASKKADADPTPENMAAAAEAELRHNHVVEYTMGLRAESGRTLAAWKDLLRQQEETRAKVTLRSKEKTGESPRGVGNLIDAVGDVQTNLGASKSPGLDKLIKAAQDLVDNADKPKPISDEVAKPRSPELQSLVDETRETLKKFGAEKDAELDAFQEALARLSSGDGNLGETVEAARKIVGKDDKPKSKVEEAAKVASTKAQLKAAAKRLVNAADNVLPKPKLPQSEIADLMEAARQAVGRLRSQNVSSEISAFREAVSFGDAARAAVAARKLIAAEAKEKSPASKTSPTEYDQTMSAARRVASSMEDKAVPERPELMPDIKDMLLGAKNAASELQKQRKSVLGDLIDAAEKQAVNMTKQKAVRKPVEALPPELQALVDKTRRIVDRFGGTAKGEKAALLLARTGRTFAEQEQLARSVRGLTPNQVAKVLNTLSTSPEANKPGWYFWLYQQKFISGMVTHSYYAMTNTATVFLERSLSPFVAALIDRARGGDASLRGPLYANVAMYHAFSDALKGATQAFKTGMRVPLASEMRLFERGEESPQAAGAKYAFSAPGPNWGIWKRVFNEDQLDKAAHALGIPGRAANFMHSFFKILSERGAQSNIAFENATKEGVTGDKFWQRYNYHLDNPTDDALRQAVNDAYSGAFMAKLTPGVGKVADVLSHTPVLKFMFPFQHIPWNIERMGIEYSPLKILGPEMRSALLGRKGIPAQNLALAKMAIGSTIMGLVMHQVFSGSATGSYPSDEKERQRWQALGIQPNSIQIAGYWVSYDRLGPVGDVIKMAANFATVVKNYDGHDDEAMTTAMWGTANAAANQFTGVGFETFKNIMEALQDKNAAQRFMASQASSLTLGTSFLSQNASFIDPYQRKVSSIIDGLKSQIPVVRETLLPKRDPVFGELVPNPGYHTLPRMSLVSTDPIKAEMARAGVFPSQPEDRIAGVKLTPELYDVYQGVAGGLTRSSLEALVSQPGFKEQSAYVREQSIRKTIEASRDGARKWMIAHYPALIDAARQQKLDYINGTAPARSKNIPSALKSLFAEPPRPMETGPVDNLGVRG